MEWNFNYSVKRCQFYPYFPDHSRHVISLQVGFDKESLCVGGESDFDPSCTIYRVKSLKQRPLAKNLPDSTGKCPNVGGKREELIREPGLRWLEDREGLVRIEIFSKVVSDDLLLP